MTLGSKIQKTLVSIIAAMILTIAPIVAIAPSAEATTSGTGTVSGQVMVGPLNIPCSECVVTYYPAGGHGIINEPQFYTNANGMYSFSLPAGSFDICAFPYQYNIYIEFYSWYGGTAANGNIATPVDIVSGTTQSNLNITEYSSVTTSISGAQTTVPDGTPATLSATVTPMQTGWNIPQGTVEFIDSATILATATINAQGVATTTLSGLAPGTYEINAVFTGGDGYYPRGSNQAYMPSVDNMTPTGAYMLTITGGTTPRWLYVLNYYRQKIGLAPVAQDPVLTAEVEAHINYMNLNDPVLELSDHYETPGMPGYSIAGAVAGESSDLSVGSSVAYSIPGYAYSAYHSMLIYDPYAKVFGAYGAGAYSGLMAGAVGVPASISTPLLKPANGSTTTNLGFYTPSEGPNPGAVCPAGYNGNTGPVLLIGVTASMVINGVVTATVVGSNGTTDPTCLVIPLAPVGSAVNVTANEIELSSFIPEYPLVPGVHYTVNVTGISPTPVWSFTAKAPTIMQAQEPTFPQGVLGHPYSGISLSSSVSGYVAPLTAAVTQGALPPGLQLNPTTLMISGTPTAIGTYSGEITIGDSSVPLPHNEIFAFTIVINNVSAPQTPTAPIVSIASTPHGHGYWEADAAGEVFAFGSAQYYGSMAGKPLNQPVTHIVATPDGGGYWLVAKDGGVFSFGDAHFYGSMGGKPLNKPVVSMAPTPDNRGYWLVASDGGVFSFGDAHFYGSMGGRPLNQPVDGIVATSGGYFEVASDGGVFAFGNATFTGSLPGLGVSVSDVVGIAPSGSGYWLVASNGGIFALGVPFYGSDSAGLGGSAVVGMAAIPGGSGYWEVAADGSVYSFGAAQGYGSVDYTDF